MSTENKRLFGTPCRCLWHPSGKGAGLRPAPFPRGNRHLQEVLSFYRRLTNQNDTNVSMARLHMTQIYALLLFVTTERFIRPL